MGVDPLKPFQPNAPCWCGKAKKYKHCHGSRAHLSHPGQEVPPPTNDSYYLSPNLRMRKDALKLSMDTGAPLYAPGFELSARPIPVSDFVAAVEMDLSSPVMTPKALGELRFHIYDEVVGNGSKSLTSGQLDNLKAGISALAAQTLRALDALKAETPGPNLLWSDSLTGDQIAGRTMLWAEHVCVPDTVFSLLSSESDEASIRRAIAKQRYLAPLISAGYVIPVPQELAVAVRAEAVVRKTQEDLDRIEIQRWVESQLILEGPTAVEALFAMAKDDTERFPRFWLHGRTLAESGAAEREFSVQMLHPYEPDFDYGPWISQVKRQATAHFVQRTNARLVTGTSFGADYLTRSPFEGRLLHRLGWQQPTEPSSALWADIPTLGRADPEALARALRDSDAVADLRAELASAVRHAKDPEERTHAVAELADRLDRAGHKLHTQIATDRRWQFVGPGLLGLGSVALGLAGGLPGVAAAALGMASGLMPTIASRKNRRTEAAFVFYSAHRHPARKDRTRRRGGG